MDVRACYAYFNDDTKTVHCEKSVLSSHGMNRRLWISASLLYPTVRSVDIGIPFISDCSLCGYRHPFLYPTVRPVDIGIPFLSDC